MNDASPTTETATTGSYHYDVMRRAIALIDAHADAAPSLEALAAEMRMSPAHFQRIFSAWAGVSPKRFQQYLTLGHAKALLASSASLSEVAMASGLSGTGRLHDLFVRWEAMTPGDWARGGSGLAIRYGWFDGPFGEMLVMATDRGVCGLAFAVEIGRDAAMADMAARWPGATLVEDRAAVAPVAQVLAAMRGEVRLHLIGAPFRLKVWEALMRIPAGGAASYGDIARAVGAPGASRAVGTAVGRNPVSWLVPCHRALRATGGMGGYHWGLPVKRALLAWEGARAAS